MMLFTSLIHVSLKAVASVVVASTSAMVIESRAAAGKNKRAGQVGGAEERIWVS